MHGRATPSPILCSSPRMSVRVEASPIEIIESIINGGDSVEVALMSNAINLDGAISGMASSSMVLSETEAWVQPLSLALGPFLSFFSFAMVSLGPCEALIRTVMTKWNFLSQLFYDLH